MASLSPAPSSLSPSLYLTGTDSLTRSHPHDQLPFALKTATTTIGPTPA